MSPKPNVSEERKDQIMNAAKDVFAHKGFDKARMDDIADKTGLSKGTLYLYFKSKDDLIIAIVNRIFQREFSSFENIDMSSVSAVEAMELFTDTIVKDIEFFMRLMPLAYEFLALAFRNKSVQKALKIYINRYMEIFLPVIQRGIETGEFQSVDAHEVGVAVGAIIEGTMLLWVYDKSLVDPKRHIRSGMKLLLEGVKAPS